AEAARAEAERAARAKDEFLAMLGHELRNPLAPIVTALQLLKLRQPAQLREHEVIERQVQHVVRLVDDLLDVSRITRGKIELKREPLELAQVVAKAIAIASPLFEERRHRLDVAVAPSGLVADADATRLAQVVANLLTNAAKYTAPGGHVRVAAARDGGELVLRVADDGIGISPELLPRVFDLFVQGDRPVDRGEGGLGLGLALVRSLVQLHGGSVTVASEGTQRGSEFVVRLPALDGVAAPASSPPPLARTPRVVTPRRVLVVDDNEDAAEMLAEMLRAEGHVARVAYDGPAALQLVADGFVPELAILDIGLPVMDGYELATRLKASLPSALPTLVALTGYGQEHDRARSARAGFALHLVKPVVPERLLAYVGGER
ncbi:MAG: histidine kinase, partial [bacterium]|nr:histidine kinase [bacterium]